MIEEKPAEQPNRKKSRLRIAIIISVVAHIGFAGYLINKYAPGTKTAAASDSQSESSPSDDSSKDPQSGSSAPISETEIEKTLQAKVNQVNQLSDEEKLSELERNLSRLDSIATPESVVQTGTSVAKTFGINTDQYADRKTPKSGSFDTKTAQIKDVVRVTNESGKMVFESVLVDSGGREIRVPMSNEEGETVYQTFQTMKRFPMAQGLYRSVVMPLMQKMLDSKDAATNLPPGPPATD